MVFCPFEYGFVSRCINLHLWKVVYFLYGQSLAESLTDKITPYHGWVSIKRPVQRNHRVLVRHFLSGSLIHNHSG